MEKDMQIFGLINKEFERQKNGLELIASENFVSGQVLQAMGSCLTNKYAEGYPNKRYYGGCQIVDQTEQLAIDRVCELFGAEYANVQPHSGAQANAAVYFAILKPGDTIMGLDLSHGGHLTHGSPVNLSGILYNPVAYHVDKESGIIDYDSMEKIAHECKPKLIIAGASAYSRDWDYERMRSIADDIKALLMADISHPAGLIAKGLLNDPLPHCHIITSTTHKTLRGPRGGFIIMNKDFENPMGQKTRKGKIKMMSQVLNSAVFPGQQGGPLQHVIASKAVSFGEALTKDYRQYVINVKKNAQKMAKSFLEKGYDIVSSGTDNHCILIDLRKKYPELTGRKVETVLESADITINKNMVPFDHRSPFQTSGLRLGTPAVTTRGCTEDDMDMIVELIDKVINNIDDEKVITAVKYKVNKMMKSKPMFAG